MYHYCFFELDLSFHRLTIFVSQKQVHEQEVDLWRERAEAEGEGEGEGEGQEPP